MNRIIAEMAFLAGITLLGFTPAVAQGVRAERYWGQWRGPVASGVAPDAKPPVTWSESKNIRWKVQIPGQGLSTPIVWGDRVFVQTAIPVNPEAQGKSDAGTKPSDDRAGRGERHERGAHRDGPPRGPRSDRPRDDRPRDEGRRGPDGGPGRRGGMRRSEPTEPFTFSVLALDRRTGKEVWRRSVREEVPHEGSHQDGSLAPSSPVTDGNHLYAYFGSRGLYCLTMSGEVVWEKDLGDMRTRNGFGEGSSPALLGDTLVVNWDHEDDSFIVALDKATGKERWRRDRDEVTSWSTPVFIEDTGRSQVVVSATKRVRSYDLATGEIVWECGGLGLNCAPTPVANAGLLFAMTGYRDPALLAIRYAAAKGDLTGSSAVVWKTDKGTSYVPSPLLYADTLYFLKKNSGVLSCLDPRTGKPHYDQQRLEGINGVYASPVGAGDHVYIVGRGGSTIVLKRGSLFETVAVNQLDDSFTASPAIAGDELFLRGMKHLYCIAEE